MAGESHVELPSGMPTTAQKAAGLIMRCMAIGLLLLGVTMALLAGAQMLYSHLGYRSRLLNVALVFSLTAVMIVTAELADAFARYLRGRLRFRTRSGFGLWVALMASRTLIVFFALGVTMASVWGGMTGRPGWFVPAALAALGIIVTQAQFLRLCRWGENVHWVVARR